MPSMFSILSASSPAITKRVKINEIDETFSRRESLLITLRVYTDTIANRIAETVNGVAHYKEKEVCLAEDIEFEQERLAARRNRSTRIRERANKARLKLKELRVEFNEKKVGAGLLVAQ